MRVSSSLSPIAKLEEHLQIPHSTHFNSYQLPDRVIYVVWSVVFSKEWFNLPCEWAGLICVTRYVRFVFPTCFCSLSSVLLACFPSVCLLLHIFHFHLAWFYLLIAVRYYLIFDFA